MDMDKPNAAVPTLTKVHSKFLLEMRDYQEPPPSLGSTVKTLLGHMVAPGSRLMGQQQGPHILPSTWNQDVTNARWW